jgi:hypothetical protein
MPENNKSQREWVISYFSNQLNEEQEKEYLATLEADEVLKKEHIKQEGLFREKVKKGIRQINYEAFMEESSEWLDELPIPKKENSQAIAKTAKIHPIRKWLAIAAGLILLSIVGYSIFPKETKLSPVQIAAREMYEFPNNLNGEKNAANSPFSKGFEYFQNDKLTESVVELKKVVPSEVTYKEARILLSWIALRDPNIYPNTHFEEVSSTDTLQLISGSGLQMRRITRRDLMWYQALAFFQSNNLSEEQLCLMKL